MPSNQQTPATAPSVSFGMHATPEDVTPHSLAILRELLAAAGERRGCIISSTRRLAVDQARVMCDNCDNHGATSQHALYGPCGDQVIAVYEAGKAAGKTRAQIIVDMTQKIIALGPYNVSHHAADPVLDRLNVFDIGPFSLSNVARFVEIARADPRVSKVLCPPADPGVHLEIPQPA